jgi:drug/metabolite transporter (DMT)-like permease
VLFAGIWLVSSGAFSQIPKPIELIQFIGCAALCLGGLFFYVRSLQHMHFVNVSVIGICGALIHYLMGIYLNQENFNQWFYLSALLCISGILIQWRKQEQHKGLIEAIASALLWGFGYALLSIPLQTSEPVWGAFIFEFVALLGSAFYLIIKAPSFSLLNPPLKDYKIFLVATFTIIGSIWMNFAYQQLQLSVLGFMQLSFFPYSIIAGYFLFKEKLSKTEWLGNLLVIGGLLLYYYFL